MDLLHSLLSQSVFYNLGMWALGSVHARSVHVSEYICPKVADRVLDVGCGTADILNFMPPVDYIGLDYEPNYIESARKRFGNRATFFCKDVTLMAEEQFEPFDIVLATGVLHHLSDAEAISLLSSCKKLLKPSGRMITYDGCRTANQHPFDTWMLDNDRGQFVRNKAQYIELVSSVFPGVEFHLRTNLLRIPYTHAIMELSPSRKTPASQSPTASVALQCP